MAGPKITEKEAKFFILMVAILFVIVIAIVGLFVVWFLCLLSWAQISTWPSDVTTSKLLVLTGIVISVSCAILAMGSAVGLVSLDKRVQLAIWTSFIGGLFLSVVQWLKGIIP